MTEYTQWRSMSVDSDYEIRTTAEGEVWHEIRKKSNPSTVGRFSDDQLQGILTGELNLDKLFNG